MDIVSQETIASQRREEQIEVLKGGMGRERRGGRPGGKKEEASRVVWSSVCFERRPDNQRQRAKHEHQHCIL